MSEERRKPLELAVVVPTLNERQNAIELIGRLEMVLAGTEFEIIVVDDDSADGTAAAVRELAAADRRIRVIQRIHRRGLSSACIEGIMATAARYVAVIDADLQHDENALPTMLARLKNEKLDIVVGTRHAEGGSSAGLTSSRARLSNFGKTLSRFVTRNELTDPMSGFFVVDRRFFDEVVRSLSGSGFKILLDMVASAGRPVRIGEVPYHFRPRRHGESKLDFVVGVEYFELLVDKVIGEFIPPRFVLFAAVGGTGVILHLVILYVLMRFGVTFSNAQLIATVLVMTSNFFLNNLLTWRDYRLKGMAALAGLLKFYVACSIGALVNLQVATFAWRSGAPWYLAGFAGLVVGSVWNFAVTATMTWQYRRRMRSGRRAALATAQRAARSSASD